MAEKNNLVYLSITELLEDEVQRGTEVGLRAKELLVQEDLVPDEVRNRSYVCSLSRCSVSCPLR